MLALSLLNALTLSAAWSACAQFAPTDPQWSNAASHQVLMVRGTYAAANSAFLYVSKGNNYEHQLIGNFYDSGGTPTVVAGGSYAAMWSGPRSACFGMEADGTPKIWQDGRLIMTGGSTVSQVGSPSICYNDSGACSGAGAVPFVGVSSSRCEQASTDITGCSTTPPGRAPSSRGAVLVIGDSNSASLGDGISETPWPVALESLIGSSQRLVNNYSVAGATTTQQAANWTNWIYGKTGLGRHAVIMQTPNDPLVGISAATSWSNIQSLMASAWAAGMIPLLVTGMPCAGYATWNGSRQTDYETVRASMLSYCATGPVACVDLYREMGSPSDPTILRSTWDQGDGLHINDAGSLRIRDLVYKTFALSGP